MDRHLLVSLAITSESLALFDHLLGTFFSLLLDEFDCSLRIVASFLVGSECFLESELTFGMRLDQLHHSGVELDLLEIFGHSEFDGDSLTEGKAFWSLQGEHDFIKLLVVLSQLTRDRSLLDLERNVESETGHGLNLLNRNLDIFKNFLHGCVEEADELAARLVGPVGVVLEFDLEVAGLRLTGNDDLGWCLHNLCPVDFVTAKSFPGALVLAFSITKALIGPSSPATRRATASASSFAAPASTSALTWASELLGHSFAPLLHLIAPCLPSFFIIKVMDRHLWGSAWVLSVGTSSASLASH